MKRSFLLIVFALVIAGCEPGHESELVHEDDVLLVLVDGRPVTLPMLEALMEIRGVDEADEEGMRELLDELIRIRAMANAAEDEGLADEPRIRAERAIKDMETLYVSYVERVQRENPVSEEEIRQVYDAQVERAGDRQFRVETLAYPDQSSALRALEAAEDEGIDFATMAEQSGQVVQPVGWVDTSQVPSRFAVELAESEAGQVVPLPLEYEGQWLAVHVTDTRALEPPAFEDLQEGIRRRLNRERVQALIDTAYDAADIEPMLPMDEAGDQ